MGTIPVFCGILWHFSTPGESEAISDDRQGKIADDRIFASSQLPLVLSREYRIQCITDQVLEHLRKKSGC